MALFLFDPQQGPQIMPPSVGQSRFAPLPLQETQAVLFINRLPPPLFFRKYICIFIVRNNSMSLAKGQERKTDR
jgi:hypothetical protein